MQHKRYTVSFRYTKPGEKKPGPVQRYVLYADSLEEAREAARRYATYPNIEIIGIQPT